MNRAEALRRWEELPFPTRTDELWRRTDISGLDLKNPPAKTGRKLPDFHVTGEYAGVIGVDDERVCKAGEGVCTIEESGVAEIGDAFQRTEKKFSTLNDANFVHGTAAILRKPTERPFNLISLFRGGHFFPRSLVVVEPNASGVVLDERLGQGEGLVIGHTEIRVKQGGRLTYIRLQNLPPATNFETIHVVLERDAALDLATIDLGGKVSKITLDLEMAETGAEFTQTGLIRATGEQHFDVMANVHHEAPSTKSNLLIKSAVRDKSRTVFTGLIKVDKKAVKTDAFQTNRNLLLSKGARADSIPKLEILADDVKCGHGSATGPVDRDQMFYLESRGIPPAEAERLIVEGFFEDALGRISLSETNEWIRENLRSHVH
jgi:Fe-S cluster assembly protein SufD